MKKKTQKNLQQRNAGWFRNMLLIACLLISQSLFAQTKTVTGTVTDTSGETLIGVSVMVKGTSVGVVTDIDGKYSINAAANATLDFSYVGMIKQSVPVSGKSVVNVVMAADSHLLNETVVIGYGSAKKRDLTGSIVNVKGEDLTKQPVTNAAAALQGKVAGVQVVNSGRAGKDPEIRVRGTNSINGYTPLYVVDGLFTDNISYINPEDIESMEILKDPSSLAIFGVRGANGVIIVTTKQAKNGQTRVNINTSFGWKHVTDKIKVTNAAQFKELYNEQLVNQGNTPFDFSGWNNDTDWQDEIFQDGFITNNNVSISGSTDRNSFYMGVGYAYEDGNIKKEKYSKLTFNISDTYNVLKNFKVGFQFTGARVLPTDEKEVLNAVRATPVGETYNQATGLISVLPDFQKAQISNPLVNILEKANTTRAENYYGAGNIFAELDFAKHFKAKVVMATDYRSNNSRTYTPIIQCYDAAAAGGIVTLGDGKTAISQIKENEMKVQSDYTLSYDNQFGDHGLNATVGFTTFYNKLEQLEASRKQGDGLPIANDPDKWYVSIGDANATSNGSTQWERSTVSFLARAIYNYAGKYLVNASYRRDGSSAFSYTGNQWQNFYSFGAGWIMTEENFMKDQKFFDMLKIKGSWGTLGNQSLSTAYPAQPLLESAGSAVFGDNIIPGYKLEFLPNANLRWEKVEAYEFGFEASMLRNRLYFDAVYYNKTTKDLLAKVPGISGSVPGIGNLGTLRNRGVELSATWRDKVGDWSYSIGANLTTINNKVLDLVQDGYSIIDGDKSQSYTMGGYPIGFFYGYEVEGIYQNDAEIANSPKNTLATVKPGDLKFRDIDGNGSIGTEDRTMIGNPTPDVTYGINLSVGYKGFELGIDMMGQGGNEIYRTWDNYNWSQFNYLAQRMDRWHGEGTSNTQPILDTTHTVNNLTSSYYVEDGSFFRIRNINFAYNFGRPVLSKLHMQALKVYFNAQNVKTWKHNTGYTPEIGGSATAFGSDSGSYPMPIVYTFGLNLTF